MNSINLKISPRFVRQDKDGVRPFQRQTIDAIKNSNAKLIFVEAPVGAGKSYIIRNLIQDNSLKRRSIILTYPTKILMDSQLESIRRGFDSIAVWPDDKSNFPLGSNKSINILKYSTDSLVQYLNEEPNAFEFFRNRGEFIRGGLFSMSYGGHQVFVTTPDVLWLIYSMRYRGAKIIQSQLNSALVFFDEFHTYANLCNFYHLLENLISKSKVDKVVLLSATPYLKRQKWSEIEAVLKKKQISIKYVGFENSEGKEGDTVFNYPLEVELRNFKYTNKDMTLKNIIETLNRIQLPAAIIFDSIFRLRHIKPEIERLRHKFFIREWSGLKKDKDVPELIKNQEKVIILGTSAIEVGIDMKLRTLITESGNWASAIQRIGRVGRMPYFQYGDIYNNKGLLHLFVDSRDTFNRLEDKIKLSRDSFEVILHETLSDPAKEMIGGELFRGESYNFILFDKYLDEPVVYSEAILSMYEINDSQCRNFWGDDREKRDILKDAGIKDEELINKLILHDKLFPIWGIIISDGLRDTYVRIIDVRKEKKPRGVTIYTESNPAGYRFYKEKPTATYLEQSPW